MTKRRERVSVEKVLLLPTHALVTEAFFIVKARRSLPSLKSQHSELPRIPRKIKNPLDSISSL